MRPEARPTLRHTITASSFLFVVMVMGVRCMGRMGVLVWFEGVVFMLMVVPGLRPMFVRVAVLVLMHVTMGMVMLVVVD